MTVECHTKIRLRHRKRPHSSHSKVKAVSNSSAGMSSHDVDSTEQSPLKIERLEDGRVVENETASKRMKLDLPDSGCDCSADKMDSDSSPLSTETANADQAGSEHVRTAMILSAGNR